MLFTWVSSHHTILNCFKSSRLLFCNLSSSLLNLSHMEASPGCGLPASKSTPYKEDCRGLLDIINHALHLSSTIHNHATSNPIIGSDPYKGHSWTSSTTHLSCTQPHNKQVGSDRYKGHQQLSNQAPRINPPHASIKWAHRPKRLPDARSKRDWRVTVAITHIQQVGLTPHQPFHFLAFTTFIVLCCATSLFELPGFFCVAFIAFIAFIGLRMAAAVSVAFFAFIGLRLSASAA